MTCPVCGAMPGDGFRAAHVMALKCAHPACGHIYAKDPAPDQGVEGPNDPDVWLAKYAARNAKLIQFWHERGVIGSTTRVLDFGAGTGHILRSVKEAFPQTKITFVEANDLAADQLQARGFNRAHSAEDAPGSFDLILLIEVIEHVTDPLTLLRTLKPKLAPGGRIFITTPSGEDRRGGRAMTTYDDPAHVHFFTEKSLTLCAERAGLDIAIEHIGAMQPPERAPLGPIKGAARWVRAKLLGHYHLTGFGQVSIGNAQA